MTAADLTAIEPTRWILVFQRSSKIWWVRALAWGKYQHVAAYAYLPGFKAWLIYEVSMLRTSIVVVPDDDEGLGWLYELTKDSDLVAVQRQDGGPRAPLLGWCVPAIARLVGLRTFALRPDALFRACRAAGGDLLTVRCPGNAAAQSSGDGHSERPAVCPAAG